MATYHEPMHLSDVLLHEVSRGWTTQNVKVKTDVALAIGTVLYYVDGQDYFTGGASKGNGVVANVLADNVKPSDEPQTALAIVRGAVVATENLIFPDGTSDDEKKQALSMLNVMGIMTQGEILPILPSESTSPQPMIETVIDHTQSGSYIDDME